MEIRVRAQLGRRYREYRATAQDVVRLLAHHDSATVATVEGPMDQVVARLVAEERTPVALVVAHHEWRCRPCWAGWEVQSERHVERWTLDVA